MLKAYKIEIKPTEEQIKKINKTIGVCRFIYNFYIAHNKEVYQNDGKFVSGMSFSKWLNNDFIPNNRNYLWIKDVSSKAVKQSIMNGEKAFKQFFKKETGFPKFKKKNRSNVGVYLPKNNKTDFIVERHRAKIPTLGFVRLKEFATVSDERIFKNINKTYKVKKLKKSLKKEQRKLSRKYESLKIRNKEEGGNVTRQNVQKQVLKVQKLHNRINNIRTDYINKTINELVKTKPEFINIEDLNISGMMKNRHLSKAIAEQKLYEFRNKLINKCHQNEIEVRLSNRFYASSKTCSQCGSIKKDLKLADRTYICPECGAVIDRDLNAAINLRDNQIYKIV